MSKDEKYLRRCFELAKQGLGYTAPNPIVGAVLVHQDQIIAEGYHERYGGPHAEVNVFKQISDKQILSSSTLYVNLEPCCHYGKTPPCTSLVIEAGVSRVVVSNLDPFPEVAGNGVQTLREAGIQVDVGLLAEEGDWLNRRFFTYHRKQRPYIVLKWAQSQDGFMDIDRSAGQQGVYWITSEKTKELTHTMRKEEAAILVGRRTIETDNPALTCRAVEGPNPVRIVLDPSNQLSRDFQVFNQDAKTWVYSKDESALANDDLIVVQDPDFLDGVLKDLYQKGIQSVLVEGGKYTLESFIAKGLWDEARVLTGQINLVSGLEAPVLEGCAQREHSFFHGDEVNVYVNQSSS